MNEPKIKLSVVIPLFNEEARLPPRLIPYLNYLDANLPSYEVVLVDDGSTDRTCQVVAEIIKKFSRVKLIRGDRNRGRGFGMRAGALAAIGEFVLETDADLPVSPNQAIHFLSFLEKHPEFELIIGSRGHRESSFVLDQPWQRVFAGKAFHLIFGFLFNIPFKDVMCGFKIFRHNVAQEIFTRVYDERYLAAGEIVYVARKFNYQIKELPVRWEDNRESKVKIIRDSIRTTGGLFKMLSNDLFGRYEQNTSFLFKEATNKIKLASGRFNWPAVFTRIRFFTAPYFRLSEFVPKQGSIIDLGSGYGIFANILGLLSPSRQVIGLDLDKYKSDHAVALSPNVKFQYGDITKTNIPPTDCILLIHVLHHLNSFEEQEVLLKACWSQLKSGGKLVIAEIDQKPPIKFFLTQIADHLLYPGDTIYYRFPEKMLPLLEKLNGKIQMLSMHEKTPFSHITYIVTKQ